MTSPRRTPSLTPGTRRIPLAPARQVEVGRHRLERCVAVSALLHAVVLAALMITLPETLPPEAPPSPAVDVVFEAGAQKTAAPKTPKGPNARAQQAAPRGPEQNPPARLAQSGAPTPATPVPPPPIPAPPPPAPPAPPQPTPTPPPPKPVLPTPRPASPKPVPSPPKPPSVTTLDQPLPKVALPPPPKATPETVDVQPEVNLDLPPPPPLPEIAPAQPPLPLPPLPAPPAPPVTAQAGRVTHQRPQPGRSALGGIVMNGMSFNGGSRSGGQAPRGLNLSIAQTEQQQQGPDLAITGAVGADWRAAFAQWVEDHKYYPEMAGELGQQGRVIVHFTVDRAGHVSALRFTSTSGYALLDQSWLALFRDAALPPFPPGTKADTVGVTASMTYRIIGGPGN